jgi:hypothetical protein
MWQELKSGVSFVLFCLFLILEPKYKMRPLIWYTSPEHPYLSTPLLYLQYLQYDAPEL